MEWVRRLLFSAIAAGVIAGALTSLVHHFTTVPLILRAEQYEARASLQHPASTAAAHETPTWVPVGWARTLATTSAEILTGIGFGLVLVAWWSLIETPITWRRGCAWGVAGFAAVMVAPSLGLPPELPGTQSAALHDRQLWWVFTVVCSASGLATIAFTQRIGLRLLGAGLLLLPQVAGAPQPRLAQSLAPEALMQQFTWAVLSSSLCFWLLLGAIAGGCFNYFGAVARVPDRVSP